MDRQDLREKCQLDNELWLLFCEHLSLDQTKCNPDFMVCSEEMARAGKVFDLPDTEYPTEQQCVDAVSYGVKELAKKAIREKYDAEFDKIAKPYLAKERETWTEQKEEATAYSQDPEGSYPLLELYSTNSFIPVAEIAQNILDKASEYKSAVGIILGKQKKELDDLG